MGAPVSMTESSSAFPLQHRVERRFLIEELRPRGLAPGKGPPQQYPDLPVSFLFGFGIVVLGRLSTLEPKKEPHWKVQVRFRTSRLGASRVWLESG